MCSECNETSSNVLNSLKLVEVNRRRAIEDRVTVIQTPMDRGTGDGICSVLADVVLGVT